MDHGKFDTLNASPVNFSETDLWMGMIPASADGKQPRRMGYTGAQSHQFQTEGVEFNVYAPDASSVEVSVAEHPNGPGKTALAQDGKRGLVAGRYPQDPGGCSSCTISLMGRAPVWARSRLLCP